MIERGIIDAPHSAKSDSKQEYWRQVLKTVYAAARADGFEDAPLVSAERSLERRSFTAKEEKVLKGDGAILLSPLGQAIPSQREDQRQKGKPSFYYVTNAQDGLLDRPSRLAQVAIYPDPDRFFVPGTAGKDLATQERLASDDGESLRQRLGLPRIDVEIPEEAATLTGVTFDYLDQTGEWLFGSKYGYLYGRTKNPTNRDGSDVACVGDANPGGGLDVDDFDRGSGDDNVQVVRLVVPSGNK